jgi:CRISPR-associated protein Csb2
VTTTLVVRFPLGRCHATPWGSHVNEGRVEFPPSPWRLLRALYATWREREPDLGDGVVTRTLSRLAEPPVFHVPPFHEAHTRHWYPDFGSRRGESKPGTDRTLDAFVAVDPRSELAITWETVLDRDERPVLERLAASLPYLGRADSVCEARVAERWEADPAHETWEPAGADDDLADVRLLSPDVADGREFDLEALVTSPLTLRTGRKLLFPPGARHVGYVRRHETDRRRPRPVARAVPGPTVVRLTLAGVRPMFTDALAVTDLLHRAAAWHLDRERGAKRDSLLLGRCADGSPMTDDHRHAHYLCLPDEHRRVGEVLVWTPDGLEPDEVTALSRIDRLKPSEKESSSVADVPVLLSGLGGADLLPDEVRGPATRWRSLTPYVPTGHPKRDRGAFIWRRLPYDLGHVRREGGRSLPPTVRVAESPDRFGVFERRRAKDRTARRFVPPAAFVELEFAEPVEGPLCVGALSHFGLGLFRAVPDD